MKHKNALISALTALTAVSLLASMTGCGELQSSTPNAELELYTINVKNLIGVPFENVTVSLKNENQVVAYGDTNAEGVVELEAALGQYDIIIDNEDLPEGYYCYDDTYKTDGEKTTYDIEVLSEVIFGDAPKNLYYEVGSVMYDFSFTNTEGKKKSLLNELQQKEFVVINIWATWCGPCKMEFPFLNQVYEEYKDVASVFALSYDDSNSEIRGYKQQNELTFDMGHDTTVISHVKTNGIPTTLLVDRYGMITKIHIGSIVTAEEWREIFESHTGDDYRPSIKQDSGSEDSGDEEQEQERVKPTTTMPSTGSISDAICQDGFSTIFTSQSNDEYAWPFIISEDGNSIEASNSGTENSYAIINFEVNMTKDQVFAFDYKMSSEMDADILYVVVDGDILHKLSGVNNEFETCYAYVANKDGKLPVTFIYQKDGDTSVGLDTAFIKNLRYLTIDDIEKPTYIKRPCVTDKTIVDNKYLGYVDFVLSSKDNYYHVGDENGPLILCDLLYGTYWDGNNSFYLYVNENTKLQGTNEGKTIVEYARYASNNIYQLVPVNEELLNALNVCLKELSNVEYSDQFLELCYYYDAYGKDAKPFESPITGLALFDPLYANLGENNTITYETPILPRGKYCEFIPTQSGAYRINALGNKNPTIGWIFNDNKEIIYESNDMSRKNAIDYEANVDMYAYFEAGVTYYINIAFVDYLQLGTLTYSLEYLGETASRLEKCSPTSFTTAEDENGEMDMSQIISLGIDCTLADDGYYHELKANGELGSIIYADFKYSTGIFSETLVQVATKGGFINSEATAFDSKGYEMTVEFASYIDSQIQEGEFEGLVPVDARLKELLQFLMDKYTFEDVEGSWQKLCYYEHCYEALN